MKSIEFLSSSSSSSIRFPFFFEDEDENKADDCLKPLER